jgi:lysophospholipase L1-like esterase
MREKNQNVKSFYIFGDSICYGQLVNVQETWAFKLAKKFGQKSQKNTEILFQNKSVNGNTTRQALERLYFDVLSFSPTYVLIQFGLNDCNNWQTDNGLPRVSAKAFKSNLEEIILKCFSAGVQVVFINTNHLTQKKTNKKFIDIKYNKRNTIYNSKIREIFYKYKQKKYRIVLNDIEKKWIKNINSAKYKTFLLTDGIHLSKKGHSLYSKILIKSIKKYLL